MKLFYLLDFKYLYKWNHNNIKNYQSMVLQNLKQRVRGNNRRGEELSWKNGNSTYDNLFVHERYKDKKYDPIKPQLRWNNVKWKVNVSLWSRQNLPVRYLQRMRGGGGMHQSTDTIMRIRCIMHSRGITLGTIVWSPTCVLHFHFSEGYQKIKEVYSLKFNISSMKPWRIKHFKDSSSLYN